MQTKFAEWNKECKISYFTLAIQEVWGGLFTVQYEIFLKSRCWCTPWPQSPWTHLCFWRGSLLFTLFLTSSPKTLVFCESCSRLKTIPCFFLGSRLHSGWSRLRGTRSSSKKDLSQLVDFWIFINKVVKHCTCFICNSVCYNSLCLNYPQFH